MELERGGRGEEGEREEDKAGWFDAREGGNLCGWVWEWCDLFMCVCV